MLDKRWLAFAGFCLVFVLLVWQLQPILSPFLTAALLAYLTDPLVDKLEAKGLKRLHSVLIVFTSLFFTIFLMIGLIVPLLLKQLINFIHQLPDYILWIQGHLIAFVETYTNTKIDGIPVDKLKAALMKNWSMAGNILGDMLVKVSSSSMSVALWFTNLVLVPVVTFYLLRDWRGILDKLHLMLPRYWEGTIVLLIKQCDEVLSAFIRGQLMVMLALGVIYSLGLSIVGLDVALFVGALAGLASVVPYLGAVIGIGAATIAGWIQFQDWMPLIYIWIVFGIGQMIEGMFLTPVLVGDKIGLHPVAVIFAVMAGGQLAGFVGVLLALPVAAILMVLLRHLYQQYRDSDLYQEQNEQES